MNRLVLLLAMAFALLPFGAAADAAPVPASRNATATVFIAPPAQVRKLQDLNFAMLSVTTAGTAVIDPVSDTMSTTGGVLHAGWTPYAALFEGIAPVKGVVIVRIPKTPITLTRLGGTETMTVDTWTISGTDKNGKRNVVAKEPFDFKVGGTLHVNANQTEGVYLGTFTVDVQYP
jgi:hypothetical protein